MPVDIHAHFWPEGSASADFLSQASRARKGAEVDLSTPYETYWKAAADVSRVVIFGGKARRSGLWTDDHAIAKFVASDRRYIGFMSLDPTQRGWEREMKEGHQELGLRGIKLLPMYAGFSPSDLFLAPLYDYAQENGLPILFHTGTTFVSQAPISRTLPRHVDEVAIRWPQLRMIMAHLGHPFEGECIAVFRKHPNVFADISALVYRRWQLFHSLMLVQEYGVWDKLLFGTDFPFTTAEETIRGLRALTEIEIGGFRLPIAEIEALIARDPLPLLGLDGRSP